MRNLIIQILRHPWMFIKFVFIWSVFWANNKIIAEFSEKVDGATTILTYKWVEQ